MLKKNLVPCTEVVRMLALSYSNVSISSRKIYDLILSADIPAQRIRNRYYVNTSDLPKIAKNLGLEKKQAITEAA